ncbi:MAG: hypothetical protein ACR2MG_19905 [Pyrinomonadaceae bacterium]
MKLAKIFIVFTFLLAFTVCVSAQDKMPKIFWKNVEAKYENFREINPILVNQSNKAIYLPKLAPLWDAHLQRFNNETQKWEEGASGMICATVIDPDTPIKIDPKKEWETALYWQISTDDYSEPKVFKTEYQDSRPLIGKYRLYIQYAFEPWTGSKRPKQTFMVFGEFEIVEKK